MKRHLEMGLKYFDTIRPQMIDKGMIGQIAVIQGTNLVGVFSANALAHIQAADYLRDTGQTVLICKIDSEPQMQAAVHQITGPLEQPKTPPIRILKYL